MNFCNEFANFCAEFFFAISAPNTSFASPNAAPTQTRVAPTIRALRSTKSVKSLAFVARRAPKSKKMLQPIRMLSTQILRKCTAERVIFLPSNAHLTQPVASALLLTVRNGAGCRCGALRVKNAKYFQRFREFLRGKFTRSRHRTRVFACPDIAPTQTRAALTSGLLHTARSENAAATFARRAPKNLKINLQFLQQIRVLSTQF